MRMLGPNATTVERTGIWPETVTNQRMLLSATVATSQDISQETVLKATAKPLWSATIAMSKDISPKNAKVESL